MYKIQLTSLITLFSLVAILLKPESDNTKNLLIRDVNIIDMESDRVLKSYDMLIEGEKIKRVRRQIEVSQDVEEISLSGRYLIPALFDMHAHISTQNPWHEYQLALYRYFGIHAVNFMAGNDSLRKLKNSIAKSDDEYQLAPKIYLASELIDGDPPLWGEQHNGPIITKPEEVEQVLNKLKKKGYTDIKIYNRLSEQVYLEVLDTAEQLGLNVVGHVPFGLSAEYQLDERHQRIEHLEGYLNLAYGSDPDTLPRGYSRTSLLLDGFDRTKMIEAARLTVKRGIWNTPTHVLFTSLIDSGYINEVISGEVSKLLDPQTERMWSQVVNNENQMPHLRSKKFQDIHLEMINILHEEEAKILAGTDAPQPVLLYGHSLHKELQYFVKAGMTPFEALITATVNPAEYLGLDKRGKLLKGYKAEMIVLKANPLADIKNTLAIEGYISGNKYRSKQEMAKLLLKIQKKLE